MEVDLVQPVGPGRAVEDEHLLERPRDRPLELRRRQVVLEAGRGRPQRRPLAGDDPGAQVVGERRDREDVPVRGRHRDLDARLGRPGDLRNGEFVAELDRRRVSAQRRPGALGAGRLQRRPEGADRGHHVRRCRCRRDRRRRALVPRPGADPDRPQPVELDVRLDGELGDRQGAVEFEVGLDLRAQLEHVRSLAELDIVELVDLRDHPPRAVPDDDGHARGRQRDRSGGYADAAVDGMVKRLRIDGRRGRRPPGLEPRSGLFERVDDRQSGVVGLEREDRLLVVHSDRLN